MASSPSTATGSFELATAQLKPGTVAIVTGAAEGLGKSFAEGLLEKGVKGVSLADVDVDRGRQTLKEFTQRFGEDRVLFVKCDVTSASDMEALFAKTKEVFGAVNLVVNNAGIVNEKDYELAINVNVTGLTRGTFMAIRYMSQDEGGKGGLIINISSTSGFVPIAMLSVYVATKHAVIGLTRSLMAEPRLQARGITFGVLCPGFVDTRLYEKWVLRHQEEEEKDAQEAADKYGVLKVSEARDAFLQLVLDKTWSGKVMVVTKGEGIYEHVGIIQG